MEKDSRCLVAVAMGRQFEAQTDRMVLSFTRHNPGWEVERYYGDRLQALLPVQCRYWTPFNQCEIGRWLAFKDALSRRGRVMYCDGDIRWYAPARDQEPVALRLYPHYVTRAAKRSAKHWLMKDGIANIGVMELFRRPDTDEVLGFVVGEVLHAPQRFMHGPQLWLQNLVSSTVDCGLDACYDDDPGMDVASWNYRHGDRRLVCTGGEGIKVECDGALHTLRTVHFSSKSLDKWSLIDPVAARLIEDYKRERK